MKKFLTLRNVLICGAVLFALLVFLFSFMAAYRVTPSNGHWYQSQTIIWGSRTTKNWDGSSYTASANDAEKALGLPIVGAIFALLVAGGLVLVLLLGEKLFKDEKIRKIVLFALAGLLVLAGIFTFFAQLQFETNIAKEANMTLKEYHDFMKDMNWKASCGLPIVSGILAMLGGAAVAASQFIPDKQLAK